MLNWKVSISLFTLGAALATAQLVIPLDPTKNEFPEGVAIDKIGNIYVTIQSLCEVRRYTPDYLEIWRLQLVRSECTGAGGLAVDAMGTVFAAVFTEDESTRGVYQIEPWGRVRRLPGTGAIEYPNGLTLDRHNGNIYVTDFRRGAIWKIPPGKPAELWIEGGLLKGNLPLPPGFPGDLPLGPNGIVFWKDRLIVAITFAPRLVSVPVNPDGTAGTPVLLTAPPAFIGKMIFALDGLALDVHGNIYVASPSSRLVARVSGDGSEITPVATVPDGITASPLSLAFGTGKGEKESIFVTINSTFGGVGSGLVRVPVGKPGLPLP